MPAIPAIAQTPLKFHVKVMAGSTELACTTQMAFTSSDASKATVAASGLQDCVVTPVGANADGSLAGVTITATLPASSVYGPGSGSQDLVIGVIPVSALIFAPVN